MRTYTVKQISEMLNTNPETVRRWIRSGKLEATQDSRKSGNIITEEMLKAFLLTTPKYAGILAAIYPPVGFAAAGIATVGGLITYALMKNEKTENTDVTPLEVKKILMDNAEKRRGALERKKKVMDQLEYEIRQESEYIKGIERMIEEISRQESVSNDKEGRVTNE